MVHINYMKYSNKFKNWVILRDGSKSLFNNDKRGSQRLSRDNQNG